MDKRKWFSRIESSQRDLRDAKRWVETEEAITWVCDKIRASVLWAMEAWFLQRGIEPDFGNGWLSMQLQFFEIAPKALSQKGMWALSETTFLEYELEEDSWKKGWSFERWKRETQACVKNVQEFLEIIKKDTSIAVSQLEHKLAAATASW